MSAQALCVAVPGRAPDDRWWLTFYGCRRLAENGDARGPQSAGEEGEAEEQCELRITMEPLTYLDRVLTPEQWRAMAKRRPVRCAVCATAGMSTGAVVNENGYDWVGRVNAELDTADTKVKVAAAQAA